MTRSYYCSQKFDWLEVRLYDGFVSSCCEARPDRLTVDFLKQNPRGFFNWPVLVQERELMLDNQRIPGCETACWQPQDQGSNTRQQRVTQRSYTGTWHVPRTINLVVNNTCNLTCSYCCKNFSSSWLRDVVDNGNYNIPGFADRYNASLLDQTINRVGQRMMDSTQVGALIMQQIQNNIDQVEEVVITGGEPLLYADLERILDIFQGKKITVFTGLGFPTARLKKVLPWLKQHNVVVKVSAENTGQFHEFNRHGSSTQLFDANLAVLMSEMPVIFAATVSNLTLFDFANFLTRHQQSATELNFVYDPNFLHPGVMDPDNKIIIQRALETANFKLAQVIMPALQVESTSEQRSNLVKFLQRFTASRNISTDIFPASFLTWLNKI